MKKLLFAISLLFVSLPASASWDFDYRPEELQHKRLLNDVESLGVQVVINDGYCEKLNMLNGFYFNKKKQLYICQDNRLIDGKIVEWTENDFDTIRHEAFHLIQDCIDGKLGDGKYKSFYSDDELIQVVLDSGITMKRLRKYVNLYTILGESSHGIMLELEAISSSKVMSADDISKMLNDVCLKENQK